MYCPLMDDGKLKLWVLQLGSSFLLCPLHRAHPCSSIPWVQTSEPISQEVLDAAISPCFAPPAACAAEAEAGGPAGVSHRLRGSSSS